MTNLREWDLEDHLHHHTRRQTGPDSQPTESFILLDAAIAGSSLSYMGQGNPGTLCGPHSGLPQIYTAALKKVTGISVCNPPGSS